MWSIHKNKECTFVWTWNTSYMDTNKTHMQIYSNWFKFLNIIIRTQFLIQLAITHTIHQTQGLTLNYLTFDPIDVYKHGLTYITFFHVKILFIYTFFNLCKWFFLKLIQVLPWRCANYKALHNEMYLSPNHIHFVIHMY
jgi:hypothetical protein